LRDLDEDQQLVKALATPFRELEGRLLVSCQAPDGDAFRDAGSMARFARAAAAGGAGGIRANGVEDVRAIHQAVPLPIIGIDKQVQADGKILITPSVEAARALRDAGAAIIALDCTARGRRYGALERLARIRAELGVPVMADIATVEEAVAAARAGADVVASTMRGYTVETAHVERFEPAFITALVAAVDVPVLAEGRIGIPAEAASAIEAGALAVIVGTAITLPRAITQLFSDAVKGAGRAAAAAWYLGIDLGGTNTKYGLISPAGELVATGVAQTPPGGGREVLLAHLKRVAGQAAELARKQGVTPAMLGIATAGWVDSNTGHIAYATDNLPGWTGTPVGDELAAATGLPVAVENDANALAMAEKHYGAARQLDNFVCITLGTGVGGGCYVNGKLNRGANFFANGLGHITLDIHGLDCTCGRKGCLEVYANAAALVRYAHGAFRTAEDVVNAAHKGDANARAALRQYAAHLAVGAGSIIQLLDPSLVILSGGIAQNNPFLVEDLEAELQKNVTVRALRKLRVEVSALGYYGGVLGAAAAAAEWAERPEVAAHSGM
jgi:predicted NBD/HSP70 family sugar kinase/putative N-acetylmannosamine-6-phosphate epimerase